MPGRVLKYRCVATNSKTGEVIYDKLLPFTQIQASTVNTSLEPDGIAISAAFKLCEYWTKRGRHENISYQYTVPFVRKPYE